MKVLLIFCSISFLFLTGCPSKVHHLQKESALSIGNNLKPRDIKISDVKKGESSVEWKATTPDGVTYNCEGDPKAGQVNCVK